MTSTTTRIPLSVQQEFLCMWDKGDDAGPFGPRFHIVDGWRLSGPVDTGTLRVALYEVVARHEALRTLIVRDAPDRYQQILPPKAPDLEVRDLSGGDRDLVAEELLNEVAASSFNARELPLLRAVLGRFDDQDSVLALIAHHTAADAWSMQLIMRDLAEFYAARRASRAPELPVAAQYREYAEWQGSAEAVATKSRAYWRETLQGAQAVALPTDRLRSENPDFLTAWHRFSYGPELRAATAELASAMRCSPFMVVLAAFAVFVAQKTDTKDVVLPTFTPGRNQARFQDAVGSFFNCLPVRIDLAGCANFREVVARTRKACLAAYTHEIPLAQVLEEAPDLMGLTIVDSLASSVFQFIQTPYMADRDPMGDVQYSAIRRKVLSQEVGSDIPDGTLLCLEFDATGDLIGELGYSTNLYDPDTARDLVTEYKRVLGETVAAPDSPLTR